MKLFSSRFVCVCAFAIVSTRVHCASVDTLTEQIHVFGRKKNRIGGKMLKQRQQQQNTNKLNQTKYSSVQGCQHLCSFSVLRCRLYVIAIRHLSNENVASRINRIRFHERPYALERQLKWTTGWKRSGAHDAVSGVYGIGCLRITIFQLTKKRDILYVSHTKVTYETEQNGTKRNISVCRCTVKRSMLSCFPFMICTNKSDSINSRSSNSSRSSSLYIKLDEQKKASNEKKCRVLFSRRVEKRDTRTSNQFVWRWVERDAKWWKKNSDWREREKKLFPHGKNTELCVLFDRQSTLCHPRKKDDDCAEERWRKRRHDTELNGTVPAMQL